MTDASPLAEPGVALTASQNATEWSCTLSPLRIAATCPSLEIDFHLQAKECTRKFSSRAGETVFAVLKRQKYLDTAL